jgi:hypothetical protein
MTLEILSARRAPPGASACAFANVKLSDDVAVFNVKIVEKPDGRRAAYAPNAHGQRVVTFSPALASAIADAAINTLAGACAHDPRR